LWKGIGFNVVVKVVRGFLSWFKVLELRYRVLVLGFKVFVITFRVIVQGFRI
jgi:hypothetical protein